MTDKTGPATEPVLPAIGPESAHALRPDPAGVSDPIGAPGEAPGDFTLRPDPRGLHDPRPHAAAGPAADAVRAGASEAGERAAGLADHARERVGDIADDVRERLGGAAEDARDRVDALHRRSLRRVDELTVQGVDGLRRGRNAVERFVDENPLLVGVVGVAAGLLLGALLPRTRQEDRNIGPLADEMRDQGLRYAREVTSMGREFVQTALDPDNLNAAARKVADAETPAPPESERARHTL